MTPMVSASRHPSPCRLCRAQQTNALQTQIDLKIEQLNYQRSQPNEISLLVSSSLRDPQTSCDRRFHLSPCTSVADMSWTRGGSSAVSPMSSTSSIDSPVTQSSLVNEQNHFGNANTDGQQQAPDVPDASPGGIMRNDISSKGEKTYIQEHSLSNCSDPDDPGDNEAARVALSDVSFDWWLLELSAVCLSVGSTAAVVGVVTQFHNRPLEDWPYRLTINTLVSFLISLSEGAMLLVVASALSPVKWLWFYGSKARSLNDIQVIDSATRGHLGALQLIWHTPRLGLATCSALIIILSFGMDPFTQQILSFPQRHVPEWTASVGYALHYLPTTTIHYFPIGDFQKNTIGEKLPSSTIVVTIHAHIQGVSRRATRFVYAESHLCGYLWRINRAELEMF